MATDEKSVNGTADYYVCHLTDLPISDDISKLLCIVSFLY
jgi:hypothetical protein